MAACPVSAYGKIKILLRPNVGSPWRNAKTCVNVCHSSWTSTVTLKVVYGRPLRSAGTCKVSRLHAASDCQ